MAWQDREKEWKTLLATQQALGEICMVWAALDHLLDRILTELLDCGPNQTAVLTTTLRDIPPRCTVIERLLLTFDFDEEWSDWLTGIMRLLRDDLGPKRNRYIHDRWMVDGEAMRKVNRTAKAPKPQPRQRPKIEFDVEETVRIEVLSYWCTVGHACGMALRDAIQDLQLWNLSRRAPTAHTQQSAAHLARLLE